MVANSSNRIEVCKVFRIPLCDGYKYFLGCKCSDMICSEVCEYMGGKEVGESTFSNSENKSTSLHYETHLSYLGRGLHALLDATVLGVGAMLETTLEPVKK